MLIFIEFISRLSFGMGLAMALVPPRQVASGYYRNNLYVLLGLNVLAALVSWLSPAPERPPLWPALAAAGASYIGAAAWLYEKRTAGMAALMAVSLSSLSGAWLTGGQGATGSDAAVWLDRLDPIAGGMVLGTVMSAMLLGRWYLNAPGMALSPLTTLIALGGAAIGLRALLSGAGLVLVAATSYEMPWL